MKVSWVTLAIIAAACASPRRASSPPAASQASTPAAVSAAPPGTAPTTALLPAKAPDATAPTAPSTEALAATTQTAPPAAPTTPQAPAEAAPAATSTSPAPASPQELARANLLQYYFDLNRRQFDAERYFAPAVRRYISMRNTTPAAINRYMDPTHGYFVKQFESFEHLLDETTLRNDGDNALVFIERVRYYVVAKHEFQTIVAEARVEFDPSGKFVDFHHSKVISRERTREMRE